MPKYKAQAYLTQYGKMVRPGDEIELAEKQAKNLGNKVSKLNKKSKAEK